HPCGTSTRCRLYVPVASCGRSTCRSCHASRRGTRQFRLRTASGHLKRRAFNPQRSLCPRMETPEKTGSRPTHPIKNCRIITGVLAQWNLATTNRQRSTCQMRMEKVGSVSNYPCEGSIGDGLAFTPLGEVSPSNESDGSSNRVLDAVTCSST